MPLLRTSYAPLDIDHLDDHEQISAKLNDMPNVARDYGADPTDTNDCMDAFSDMFDELAIGGGGIGLMPVGTFKTLADLEIPANCGLFGLGMSSILKPTHSGTGLKVGDSGLTSLTRVTNVLLDNFHILQGADAIRGLDVHYGQVIGGHVLVSGYFIERSVSFEEYWDTKFWALRVAANDDTLRPMHFGGNGNGVVMFARCTRGHSSYISGGRGSFFHLSVESAREHGLIIRAIEGSTVILYSEKCSLDGDGVFYDCHVQGSGAYDVKGLDLQVYGAANAAQRAKGAVLIEGADGCTVHDGSMTGYTDHAVRVSPDAGLEPRRVVIGPNAIGDNSVGGVLPYVSDPDGLAKVIDRGQVMNGALPHWPVHDSAVVAHTGTIADTTLKTTTIPANEVKAKNGGWRQKVAGRVTGTGGTKTIRARVAGSSWATLVEAAGEQDAFCIEIEALAINTANQEVLVTVSQNGKPLSVTSLTKAQSTTADFDITIAVQLANAADSVVITQYEVTPIGDD